MKTISKANKEKAGKAFQGSRRGRNADPDGQVETKLLGGRDHKLRGSALPKLPLSLGI